MGRGHGGTRGGTGSFGGYSSASARDMANKYLGGVTDQALKRELADGLAAFDREFGLPDNITISLSNMSALGSANGLGEIRINSGYQSGSIDQSSAKRTLIHELTHVIDKTDTYRSKNISGFKGTKGILKAENKVFDKKLTSAYKTFKYHYGSEATRQIGRYALKSKHEFFAEALSSHLTGVQNQYTTFAYNLAKSMM